jgi:hypothetical protein
MGVRDGALLVFPYGGGFGDGGVEDLPQKLPEEAPAGDAAAAAPERGALAGPSAPTSISTRWALVTP